MMTWVDPKYAHVVEAVGKVPVAKNCTICQGVGRIIMDDGNGNLYEVVCQNCTGGQVPDDQ